MNIDDITFESPKANGQYYLNNIDFYIPTRIKNMLKDKYFKDEISFYKKLEELIVKHTSYYLFPNDICFFYPKTTDQIASKEFICDISGSRIKRNENYYRFRPILENLNTKKVYTLKRSIILSYDYENILPQNLFEFENWCQKIEQHYYEDDKIDFYSIACNMKDNALELRKFNKRK